jgi:hypothetical protein
MVSYQPRSQAPTQTRGFRRKQCTALTKRRSKSKRLGTRLVSYPIVSYVISSYGIVLYLYCTVLPLHCISSKQNFKNVFFQIYSLP